MDTTAIPYDSRIVRQLKARIERAHNEQISRQIAADTGADIDSDGEPAKHYGSPAGDEAKLRGIPVVGNRGGLGGAIRGSRPGERLH